ncbi:MAG: signal recognition particle-docking protein FtsY [Verrucomicrobiales bacterium]|jgi:fused signal recognition particle receptor|nr:signal recognition particle-docking protein FtsY [Verrucomicrobiales bacterium]
MFSFFKKWVAEIKGGKVDWDEVEAHLIQSDLGLPLTQRVLEKLRGQALSDRTVSAAATQAILELWPRPVRQLVPAADSGPAVWLIIGVNGSGKTTTIAKLASRYRQAGKKIHLVGADTFRAAAIDQLKVWADRLGAGFSAGREGGDPAAAAFQGLADAVNQGADLVLIDTAGRLHNKENLLRELEKMRRVIKKQAPSAPHETLLVLDGTNGGNALDQAKQFHKFLTVSGLIVTKLDTSAKGGAVAAIKAETGIDPLFVGLGEGTADLVEFNPRDYVARFF